MTSSYGGKTEATGVVFDSRRGSTNCKLLVLMKHHPEPKHLFWGFFPPNIGPRKLSLEDEERCGWPVSAITKDNIAVLWITVEVGIQVNVAQLEKEIGISSGSIRSIHHKNCPEQGFCTLGAVLRA